jgi:altronate dehydratase
MTATRYIKSVYLNSTDASAYVRFAYKLKDLTKEVAEMYEVLGFSCVDSKKKCKEKIQAELQEKGCEKVSCCTSLGEEPTRIKKKREEIYRKGGRDAFAEYSVLRSANHFLTSQSAAAEIKRKYSDLIKQDSKPVPTNQAKDVKKTPSPVELKGVCIS